MPARTVIALATACSLLGQGAPAIARDGDGARDVRPSAGHPVVTLDQLDLSRADGALPEEKFLREVLRAEVRQANWGAGRRARIEYRFRVDELTVTEDPRKHVLTVRCTATGWLPKGKNAKSRLTFSGAPDDRKKLVEHVLSIVARGVVTRLADLERRRRAPREEPSGPPRTPVAPDLPAPE